MGICASTDLQKQAEANRKIQAELENDSVSIQYEVKVLMLGAGESGKSTFAKQMKIIHMSGFTIEERKAFEPVIHMNVILSIRSLARASEPWGTGFDSSQQALADKYSGLGDGELQFMTPEHVQHFKILWDTMPFKRAFANSQNFPLFGSIDYFMKRLDAIMAPNYVPSDEDILLSRSKTTGVSELPFKMGKYLIRLVDVGGQRSERKKWIHCFQNVNAVLFFVAISEFDQRLEEDEKINRMHEALLLFGDISNSPHFAKSAVILFFNKYDIFKEKLKAGRKVSSAFADYAGPNTEEAVSEFIKKKFLAQCNSPSIPIYPHFTVATDTSNITKVFGSIRDIIIQSAINQASV